jgi:DNA-binding SARP family transcriptional activator
MFCRTCDNELTELDLIDDIDEDMCAYCINSGVDENESVSGIETEHILSHEDMSNLGIEV